jgi:hypothetical protein
MSKRSRALAIGTGFVVLLLIGAAALRGPAVPFEFLRGARLTNLEAISYRVPPALTTKRTVVWARYVLPATMDRAAPLAQRELENEGWTPVVRHTRTAPMVQYHKGTSDSVTMHPFVDPLALKSGTAALKDGLGTEVLVAKRANAMDRFKVWLWNLGKHRRGGP